MAVIDTTAPATTPVYYYLFADTTLPNCVYALEDLVDRKGMYVERGEPCELYLWVEKVNAMALGKNAVYSMGTSRGFWEGVGTALHIKTRLVLPAFWQKKVGLPKKKRTYKQRKLDLYALAQQLHPDVQAMHQDAADAILIARTAMLCGGEL
jgi:hypothetical protein